MALDRRVAGYRRAIGWPLIWVLALLLVCRHLAAAPQAVFDHRAVLQMLAAAPKAPVRYREEKHLALLELPIESSGWLRFEPPNTLVRELDGPGGRRFLVQGTTLTMEEEGMPPRVLQLGRDPVALALLGSLRALILGDAQALERLYRVRVEGNEAAWEMQLEPLSAELSAHLERISVVGSGDRMLRLTTYETGGDWSRLEILHDR